MGIIETNRDTIGSRLDKTKGIGAGFDFLRVFLAFSVIAYHTCSVLGIVLEEKRFLWFTHYWVLAIFFGLSGFLISGSAMRLSLRDFLINRGLRIIPALAVEIIISAFLLGAFFTTLPLGEYFRSGQVYHYMTNIVGLINYDLPGVFKDHPTPSVNISLWTVPFEIGCYAIISALIFFRLLNKPKLVLAAAAVMCLSGIGLLGLSAMGAIDFNASYINGKIYTIISGRGSRLLISFMLGIAAYLCRYKIPYSPRLFAAALIYCTAISAMDPAWLNTGKFPVMFPVLNVLVAVPLVYIMAFVGVTDMPRLPLFHRGDYSYGIYLYGFPVQQALVALLPVKRFLLLLAVEMPVITLLAMFSWHFIEKPILRLRKKFSFVARQRLAEENNSREPSPETAALVPDAA